MTGKKRAIATDASASQSGRPASKAPRKKFLKNIEKGNQVGEEEWAIERIVIGDDTVDPSGLRLHVERFFASSSTHGGNESFHPILVESLQVHTRGTETEAMTWAISGVGSRKLAKNQQKPILSFPSDFNKRPTQRASLARNELIAYCKSFPGVAINIGGPGARASSTVVSSSLLPSAGAIFCRSQGGCCVQVSSVSAIAHVRGPNCANAARSVLFGCPAPITKLADCMGKLEKTKGVACELRKMKKEVKKRYNLDKLGWIANEATGLWIVRVGQTNVVDHCVLVDGDQKLIIDCEEKCPIILREDTLRACGEDDASSLRVFELRSFCPSNCTG